MFDLYRIDGDGMHFPSREAVQERLAKSIALDADKKIHDSLVAMGWTPPGKMNITDAVARILTCVTDSAAQVDRARPVDERAAGAAQISWAGPGAAWWAAYTDTLEAQLSDMLETDH